MVNISTYLEIDLLFPSITGDLDSTAFLLVQCAELSGFLPVVEGTD